MLDWYSIPIKRRLIDSNVNHVRCGLACLECEAVISWECEKHSDVHIEEEKRAVLTRYQLRLTPGCGSCF